MIAPLPPGPEDQQPLAGTDSQPPHDEASRIPAQLREAELLQRTLWNIEEVAFMCRVGARTVWRLMADPKSGFPKPRRLRGRTLLQRDDVLAYLQRGAAR